MITLLVFTDGRWDLLARTLVSAREHLHGPITSRVLIVDGTHHPDQAREGVRAAIADDPGVWTTVYNLERLGFAGTICAAWQDLSNGADVDEPFVFHLEDDFVFRRTVDLAAMTHVLDHEPQLAQLALRRQPWNDAERAAGGIVEQWPDEYRERACTEAAWLEHTLFFTTNPCLYRRSLCDLGWPDRPASEQAFSDRLRDRAMTFGFWGARDSGEWVEHIGAERVGCGY